MIFFKLRLNSFLALLSCATLLISCLEKKAPESIPARVEDDKVSEMIQKEIAVLELDRASMASRLESTQQSLDENALRPATQEYTRKEYFQYEKMARQIDQQIDFLKIRKALREKDVFERLKKGLTLKDLENELAEYEMNAKANTKSYPWRKLPKVEKSKDPKKEKEGAESAHGEEKPEESKGGH